MRGDTPALVEAIAAQFAANAEAAAASIAEQSAEAIARLLLDSLAAAFPALCARYGEAEVRAIVRAVLPGADAGAGDHRARSIRAPPRR